MNDYRTKIDEQVGHGIRLELYQFARKAYLPVVHTAAPAGGSNAGAGATVHIHLPREKVMRQLRIVLDGGAALLEPGALQYAHGQLAVDVQKNERGNFLTRAITSAGTGESAYATRYAGTGEVWTEPSAKYFILAAMDGPGDALILDDGAFYACDAGIAVTTHIHSSISGLLSGNGLMQPKLTGAGVFAVESPVPTEEVEVVELDGSRELIVDGDLMLMYSAQLQVELRPLVRGLRKAMRSGEGLVFVFRGRGTVWLTPTIRLG